MPGRTTSNDGTAFRKGTRSVTTPSTEKGNSEVAFVFGEIEQKKKWKRWIRSLN
jgi:hypothetical protein